MTGEYNRDHVSHKRENKSAVVIFTDYFSFLAILNLMWVLSSLMIVPFFASIEAVFYCISKKLTHKEVSWRIDYVEYVKTHIWKSMKRGWGFLSLFTILFINSLIISQMPEDSNIKSLLTGATVMVSLLFLFIFFYHYSFMALTTYNMKERLIQSLVYIIRYPHYSIGIVIALIAQLALSFYFVPLFFFFSMSFPAFLFLYIIHKSGQNKNKKKRRDIL